MVEATPGHLGNTYLRRLHSEVHPGGMDVGTQVYYTYATLSQLVLKDLRWWQHFLTLPDGRFARARQSATLIPTWGDGSGTGTGGTLDLPSRALHMWKGKWHPTVYHFTSNWKELNTLLVTLQTLQHIGAKDVAGTTVFYFTDNLVTYWIAASGKSAHPPLHSLIERIKLLEMTLDCHLQVVHVPGLAMISQGTDGLSRGVWITPWNTSQNSMSLTHHVFDPVVLTPTFEFLLRSMNPTLRDLSWHLCHWADPWDARQYLHRCTVWAPPPEGARQLISFLLETWAESPRDTSAILFVPRVVPAFWHGLSKHLQALNTIYPHLTPLPLPPVLPIPIEVLYLPCFVPFLLPPRRLDPPTHDPNRKRHERAATAMRGLPPHSLER